MKHILLLLTATLLCHAHADWSIFIWANPCESDTTPSSETSYYTAYYCTQAAASQLSGLTDDELYARFSSADITSQTGVQALSDPIEYSDGTYQFEYRWFDATKPDLLADPLLGVVLYANGDDYQILKIDASGAPLLSNALFIDGEGTVWSPVSVPEPTSALLILFGLAGLSLVRRRT